LFSLKDSVTVHLNMGERENGQLPLPRRTVRSRISADIWEQIKTAYAGGIGLRAIARNMDIPEGTVLALVLSAKPGQSKSAMRDRSQNATTQRLLSRQWRP